MPICEDYAPLNNPEVFAATSEDGSIIIVPSGLRGHRPDLSINPALIDPPTDRPWAKEGDLQATTSEDVLVTDNIHHDGKVNLASTEAETPFNQSYKVQVGDDALDIAHSRQHGYTVSNRDFQMLHTRRQMISTGIEEVFIDVVNGVDNLEPIAYLNATLLGSPIAGTSSTPPSGYKFLGFRDAFDWINQNQSRNIILTIDGTTISTPLVIDGQLGISGKDSLLIRGNGTQYVRFQGSGSWLAYSSNCLVSNLIIEVNNSVSFGTVNNGTWDFSSTTFNLGATCSSLFYMIGHGDCVKFNLGNTINFGTNNQALFHLSGNGGVSSCVFSNHAVDITITGAYTGLRWAVNTPTRSLETFFVEDLSIPSNIDMSDTEIHYGGSIALLQTTFDNDSFDYAQNLGTDKPLRFLDINSGTANLTGTLASLVIDANGRVGKGNLASVGIEGDETFFATAVQTAFVLSAIPKGKLLGFINGGKKQSLAFTYVGVNVTYDKTYNDNYDLELNDEINFVY